jgi:DNA repair protein RecO (recombination protein O)
MPMDQSEAVVLRTYPFADQDKIAVLFSKEKGVLRGVAKGARKFGNRFGSGLEPMSVIRVFYYEKERRDLVTISNCDLLESFFDIQKDLRTAFTLSYFAELIEETSPSRAADELLYRLLLSVLRCLAAGGDLAFLTGYFEAWFLRAAGLLPDLGRCKACRKPLAGPSWLSPKRDGAYCADCAPSKKDDVPPEAAAFLEWVRKNPPSETCPVSFPAGSLAGIRKALQTLIIHHLEKEPKTLRCLKDNT